MRPLDELLSDYEVHEVHEVDLHAEQKRAVATFLALPIDADPLVRTLFRLRRLGGGRSRTIEASLRRMRRGIA